jgi:hypothetical protein
MDTWTWRHGCKTLCNSEVLRKKIKRKREALAILSNLLTVGASRKRKFVVYPFVDEETNGSYLFANGLNGLKELVLYA